MEHPYLRSDKVLLRKQNTLYNELKHKVGVEKTQVMVALALPKAVQEREQLLNFYTRLVPVFPEWMQALRRIRNEGWQNNRVNTPFSSLMKDLSHVLTNFDQVIATAWVKQKYKNKLFPSQLFETHMVVEQAPNPHSRITLSSERDRLGLNRVNLDWRLSPIDKHTIQ